MDSVFATQGSDRKRSYATDDNGDSKFFMLILCCKECADDAACAYGGGKQNTAHTLNECQPKHTSFLFAAKFGFRLGLFDDEIHNVRPKLMQSL